MECFMVKLIIIICIENAVLVLGSRNEKVLSLMNLVRFTNSECQSNLYEKLYGTCLTARECQSQGGLVTSSCAAGFGTCCVFEVSQCGSMVAKNCSYIQNPSFPDNIQDAPNECVYKITKLSADICLLRLDLDVFTILGPSNTLELDGGLCSRDTFQVADSINLAPTICGSNPGQHMLVDFNQNNLEVKFSFSEEKIFRKWRIKLSQIGCFSENRPPFGCLQYYTELTGRLKTFNFDAEGMSTHLANQDYSICFKRHRDHCCVQFSVCEGVEEGFSLSNLDLQESSMRDNACIEDFITIEASSNMCDPMGIYFSNRYCGRKLNIFSGMLQNSPICDCTPPFVVGIRTNEANSIIPGKTRDRGICLDFSHQRCL